MKVRIRWTETATYEVEIETPYNPIELRQEDLSSALGEPTWFTEVDERAKDWATKNLVEVSDRELDEIEVLDPVVSQ